MRIGFWHNVLGVKNYSYHHKIVNNILYTQKKNRKYYIIQTHKNNNCLPFFMLKLVEHKTLLYFCGLKKINHYGR